MEIYYNPKLTNPNKDIRIKLDYPRGETIIRNGLKVSTPDLPMYDPNLLIFTNLDLSTYSLILLLLGEGVVSTTKRSGFIRVVNILDYQDGNVNRVDQI